MPHHIISRSCHKIIATECERKHKKATVRHATIRCYNSPMGFIATHPKTPQERSESVGRSTSDPGENAEQLANWNLPFCNLA